MTLTLVLDCSFYGLTLGLARDGLLLDSYVTDTARSSGELHPELEKMLQRQQLKLTDVARLVVTVGPGSFTGIRLGLAFAEALKIAKPEVEVWGITSLQAVAACLPNKATEVWLDAAGGQIFVQRFGADMAPAGEIVCMALAEAVAQRDNAFALVTGMGLPPVVLANRIVGHVMPEAMLAVMEKGYREEALPLYVKPLEYRRAAD